MRTGGAGDQIALVTLGVNAGQLFPVLLSQTGGSAGSASTACSFTYDVTDDDGNELDEALNPTTSPHRFRRPTVGVMLAATSGLAHYAGDGTFTLDWCNEVADQEAC